MCSTYNLSIYISGIIFKLGFKIKSHWKCTQAQLSKGKILHFLTLYCPILITASFYLHYKIAFVSFETLWDAIMC